MITHYKTVETNTEPTFILTNDLGDKFQSESAILLMAHWYEGDEGEVAPKLTMDTPGVIYLEVKDIEKLIAALKEFL